LEQRKFRKVLAEHLVTTYYGGSVALKCAVMDLHIGIIGLNSSALEVACPPPGIGAKF
jgi:hypothetical protein